MRIQETNKYLSSLEANISQVNKRQDRSPRSIGGNGVQPTATHITSAAKTGIALRTSSNPFGDDDYDKSKDPFNDDDEVDTAPTKPISEYDDNLNPFSE